MPAISSLLQNQTLFNALLGALSSSTTDLDLAETAGRLNQGHPVSRKRPAPSDSGNLQGESHPSKSLKLAHSPQVSKRSFAYSKPQVNFKVLVATILFVGLESVDHWPASLAKAYAEDCFGARSWVDDPRCSILVSNLAKCHAKQSASSDDADKELEVESSKIADFYSASLVNEKGTLLTQDGQHQRRGSASSMASFQSSATYGRPRSMSVDSTADSLSGNSQQGSMKTIGSKGAEPPPNDNDSDSGDDEEMAITTSLSKASHDGNSSSSGEEDEEVVVPTSSFTAGEPGEQKSTPESGNLPSINHDHPLAQRAIRNFSRVRQRYFGKNLECAHRAIEQSLSSRLDQRTKHNSGLLASLPSFLSIPEIRRIVASNLEKWLQSPALAGLSRSLFSHTVGMMEFVDPPLPSDLAAIDSILSMRLKANLLHAHIENVTLIAKRIPTIAACRHIFSRLLGNTLLSIHNSESSISEHLKMIQAVNNVLPGKLCADGLGSALMLLLVKRHDEMLELQATTYTARLCNLVVEISKYLGNRFNGCDIMESMLSFEVHSFVQWTVEEEQMRGRLMFQLVTLMLQDSIETNKKHSKTNACDKDLTLEQIEDIKPHLIRARKVLLRWACWEYAPHFHQEGLNEKNGKEMIGAGPADFSSVLDGMNSCRQSNWMSIIRMVLFLESESETISKSFLFPPNPMSELPSEHNDEIRRIQLCGEHGGDVDDEQVWIVIEATKRDNRRLQASSAIQILEHMFMSCGKENAQSLTLTDPNLLWELYNIVEYVPADKRRLEPMESSEEAENEQNDTVPRLAYPGLWWRVTCLGLIMCGAAPRQICSSVWEEHPTVRALVKMVTSDRYRFPTVDCDEGERDKMKKIEQRMRDEESRVSEVLFLPQKTQKKEMKALQAEKSYLGPRASRRQKEKREKLLKKQLEKEKVEASKEANRRKKLLKVAQKTIMLWNPREGPRKPPKESADLIFSIGDLFDLSRVFQRSVEPDLLLKTIGGTSRGAIERAHDWLIPIISYVPETIVRLPASASCFLLLRAYGTDGEERAQLQELSAPLLKHVRQSLTGEFGKADSLRAFDLLLTDVASHNPDRRRCGRRVLHEAIGEETNATPTAFRSSKFIWMVNIFNLKYGSLVVNDAIKYLSRAASFERGRSLRYIVLALEKLVNFSSHGEASSEDKVERVHFPTMLSSLISSRPTVFAVTMASFPDLSSLAIRTVYDEYKALLISKGDTVDGADGKGGVCTIMLCTTDEDTTTATPIKAVLPLALLETACVILSIWTEESVGVDDADSVRSLVRMLMHIEHASDQTGDQDSERDSALGLASAKFLGTDSGAIPVESVSGFSWNILVFLLRLTYFQWVMLARSKSDFIAKRAALTAPNSFLPRLLMCSGLPRASLLTMIDRLGKIGDGSSDIDKLFHQLLAPSALSEWDIGRLGRRREVTQRLLGRLAAYSRIYGLANLPSNENVSFTFLKWLGTVVEMSKKVKKTKTKKAAPPTTNFLASIDDTERILDIDDEIIFARKEDAIQLDGNAEDMTKFMKLKDKAMMTEGISVASPDVLRELKEAIESNHIAAVELWLTDTVTKTMRTGGFDPSVATEIAVALLQYFVDVKRKTEALGALILKWVPLLSSTRGNSKLWQNMFASSQKPRFMWSNLVSRCCQVWSQDHVLECSDWILASTETEALDGARLIDFLLHISAAENVNSQPFGSNTRSSGPWNSEEKLERASKIIFRHLGGVAADEFLVSRNSQPRVLTLLLQMAQQGRKQVQTLSQYIVEKAENDNVPRKIQLALILRLYASFPSQMNLGIAALRSILTEAVEQYATTWLSWRSPMDDQFHDMIQSIGRLGTGRMTQALAEGSKKHPLLLLRQLGTIKTILEMDAASSQSPLIQTKPDVITGASIGDPLKADIEGRTLRIRLRHWGYSFKEGVWLSFLDAVSTGKSTLSRCNETSYAVSHRCVLNNSAEASSFWLWPQDGAARFPIHLCSPSGCPDTAHNE